MDNPEYAAMEHAVKTLNDQLKASETYIKELARLNNELVTQHIEKDRCTLDLQTAHDELAFLNEEKDKRHAELLEANKELAVQSHEKEKRAIELHEAITQLRNAEITQLNYTEGLEEIMFMTSHNVRQPIANLIGLSELFRDTTNTLHESVEIMGFITDSVLKLDSYTKQLTEYVQELERQGREPGRKFRSRQLNFSLGSLHPVKKL